MLGGCFFPSCCYIPPFVPFPDLWMRDDGEKRGRKNKDREFFHFVFFNISPSLLFLKWFFCPFLRSRQFVGVASFPPSLPSPSELPVKISWIFFSCSLPPHKNLCTKKIIFLSPICQCRRKEERSFASGPTITEASKLEERKEKFFKVRIQFPLYSTMNDATVNFPYTEVDHHKKKVSLRTLKAFGYPTNIGIARCTLTLGGDTSGS